MGYGKVTLQDLMHMDFFSNGIIFYLFRLTRVYNNKKKRINKSYGEKSLTSSSRFLSVF